MKRYKNLKYERYQSIIEKKLTSKQRKSLPDSVFVFPKERKYPIHDEVHARNALVRIAAHGTPAEIKAVKAAVKKKYPKIDVNSKEKE